MRAAAAAVVLAAACVAGCGGSATALDPVASAATKTTKAGSEHVDIDTAVNTRGNTITMTGAGDFDNTSHTGSLHMTFVGGGLSGSMDAVTDNLVIYLRSDLFSQLMPPGKTWLKIDLEKESKSLGIDLGALGNTDPSQLLHQLEKTGTVTKVGEENIGVATTHYRAQVDLSKVPGGAKLQQLTHVRYEPTDVWIDTQGFVRRMRAVYTARFADGPRTRTTMTMNFSDYGKPVNASPPSPASTFDATDLNLPGAPA